MNESDVTKLIAILEQMRDNQRRQSQRQLDALSPQRGQYALHSART